MSSRTRTGALAAAVTAALALAAAAPAASPAAPVVTYDYAVTIEGHADWNRAGVDGDASEHSDEEFTFRTHVPRVKVFDSVFPDSEGAQGTAAIVRSNFRIDGGSGSIGCTTGTLKDVTAGGWDATWSQTETRFVVRALEGIVVTTGSCNGPLTPFDVPIRSEGAALGAGPFDGEVVLPHRHVGDATITRTLKGEKAGAACPNRWFNTTICSLTWEATMTFTRIGEGVEEQEVVPVPIVPAQGTTPPLPQAPGSGNVPLTPAPQVPGTGVDSDLLVPLTASASLAPGAASASVPVSCAAACSGTLVATALPRGGARAAAAAAKVLGRTRFTARPGARKRVTVRFGRAARRAIRRAGGVRLTLTATAPGRPADRSVVTVRTNRK